jgi:hypothetical protein
VWQRRPWGLGTTLVSQLISAAAVIAILGPGGGDAATAVVLAIGLGAVVCAFAAEVGDTGRPG